MAVRTIHCVQKIPAPPQEVWDFFSSPANLSVITPPDLGFRVLSRLGNAPIYTGQFIEYRVRPLFGIPVYWKTEIMEVRPIEFFADEQRKGPYKLWRHEHYFKPIEGGVEMTDIVKYDIPYAIIGRWANSLLVRRKLYRIFEFRYRATEEKLGKWKDQQALIRFS